jgi:hypothetical protein
MTAAPRAVASALNEALPSAQDASGEVVRLEREHRGVLVEAAAPRDDVVESEDHTVVRSVGIEGSEA